MNYFDLNNESLNQERENLIRKYSEVKKQSIKLNMARGKPSREQLELSNNILNNIDDNFSFSGFDIRNYGCLEGLSDAKKIMSKLMGRRSSRS